MRNNFRELEKLSGLNYPISSYVPLPLLMLICAVSFQEEHRARDLFYALWVPDLFMERVEKNEHWSLFCPNEAPGLADCWGKEFEDLYTKYEREVMCLFCQAAF